MQGFQQILNSSSSKPVGKPGWPKLQASPTSSMGCSPKQMMGRDGSVRSARECLAPREACVPMPGSTLGRGRTSASTVSGHSARLRHYEATRGFTPGRSHTSVNTVDEHSHNQPVSVHISRHTGTIHRGLHILILLLFLCYLLRLL